MVRKKSWFGLKCLFWSPKTWPEMSQSRLRNTRFCCHKHGWKCPMVSLRYLVLVSMNMAGDGLTSCGKYPDLVSTKTVGNVPIGFLRNIWFWPPQTWPEMARLPKKNIWIWSPQTWLEMSPGFLKTFFFFKNVWFCPHKRDWRLPDIPWTISGSGLHKDRCPWKNMVLITSNMAGDGVHSQEKYTDFVPTKTAGNCPEVSWNIPAFGLHKHSWKCP